MLRVKPVDPRTVLQQFVATHRTQRAAATALGISQSYLSDILDERREFSQKMLKKLGLQRIVVRKS